MDRFDVIKSKAEYCLNCNVAQCVKGCPLGNHIPDFISCVKNEDYEAAYSVLTETSVLSPICGRICLHEKQCQASCIRGIKGEPVSIGDLEAFVGDLGIENGYKLDGGKKIDLNGKKIAVVGSGPSGLSCAAFLAKKGYGVTIFEKHDKLGGLLRHGIPDFRLDKDVLDRQIEKILDLGIDVVYGKALGKDFSLEDLREEFDAVFLAFGANVSRRMNIPGEELCGVFGANELLEYGNFPDFNGKSVAVVGGGNVAMDVARTAKRLGAAAVRVVYRRAEEQMPAASKEVQDAKAEGVEFLWQSNVVRIVGDRNVIGVECVKTELVEKEEGGRLAPVDVDGSNYFLDMDYVIMAVGSKVDGDIVSKLGVELNKWGCIATSENYMTSIPNVFAGGDLIGTEATVAWAARDGRNAAEAISRMI